jgi:hypothetical protein
MSDSFEEGRGTTPVNSGWQGLRLGQTEPAKPTVAAPPPAMNTAGVSKAPRSIPYAQRAYPPPADSRPGVLTALGIISIVVGVITLLVNGGMAVVSGYGYLMISDRQGTAAATASPTVSATPAAAIVPVPPNLAAYTGDCVAAEGLRRPARRAVIDALQAKRGMALSPDRFAMLDRLLAEAGALAFGSDGRLAGELHDTGTKADSSPAMRITNAQGLVEVDYNTATFTPAGDNKPSVRVIRNVVMTPDSRRFAAVAMADALEAARTAARGNINAIQGAVALDELRRAAVRDWPDGRFEPIPIGEVCPGRNGTVGLTVGDRSIWIFADGRTVDRRANPAEPDPVTGMPMAAVPNPGMSRPKTPAAAGPAIDMASVALVKTVEAVIGLVLAVVVLAAGIRLLNNSPSALSQHALYAVLKVGLFAATLATWNAGLNQLVGPLGRASLSPADQAARQIGVLVGMMAQFAYPVAIMCLLSNGGIRRYARGRGWDYGVVSPQAWGRLRQALDTAAGRRMLTIGSLGALAVAGLHGWCLYCAAPSARLPHGAALGGASAVALACLARRMTAKSVVAVTSLLLVALGARGQSAEPASRPATTRPAARPTVILELGKPVTGKPLAGRSPAVIAVTPAAPAPVGQSEIGSKQWFDELRSMPLSGRAERLSRNQRDIDNLQVTQAARPAAIEAVPAIAEVLLSPLFGRHAQAMTLLEKIGPCERVETACVQVMATPSLEDLRPRAVALALAFDPSGKSAATKLRPYLLSGHGMVYAQRAAARSMARLGGAGIAELNLLVYGREDSMRQMAIAALADSGPVEKRVGATARLLDDESPETRQGAANALAAMGPAGRNVLFGRIFDRPECLEALQRRPGSEFKAIWSSMSLVREPLRSDPQGKDAVIGVIRAVEAGQQAAADQALLGCIGSNASPLRQWAWAVMVDSGFIRRAGPVTQERVYALSGQARSAPGAAGMPVFAAPPALADVPAWVAPAEGALAAMAVREVSEPPSQLAWWTTGGLVAVMAFGLKRLSRPNRPGDNAEDQELDGDGERLEPPGVAA